MRGLGIAFVLLAAAAGVVALALTQDSNDNANFQLPKQAGTPPSRPPAQPVQTQPALPKGVLFDTDYDRRPSVAKTWHTVQVPHDGGLKAPLAESRMSLVAPPQPQQRGAPQRRAMKVELHSFSKPGHLGTADGDVTDTGGYIANRAEVYDRISTAGTPPARWPDPVGSVRSYVFSVYVPTKFPFSQTNWFVFTQWKGLRTGTPPLSLEIDRNRFRLGGSTAKPLGAVQRGHWTTFLVTIKFSPDPKVGWVAVRVNGSRVLPRTSLATMKTYDDNGKTVVDPSYFKQGIYRSKGWTQTQRLYFSPTIIAADAESALRRLREYQRR